MQNITVGYYGLGVYEFKIPITVTRLQSGDFTAWVRLPPNASTLTITGYSGTGGTITMPSEINGKSVTAIAKDVFSNKQITGVAIPNGILEIGDGAFKGNQLMNVIIPDSVNVLG